jgi:hypothetical protein
MIDKILLITIAIIILKSFVPCMCMFILLNQSLKEVKISKFEFINQLSDNSPRGGIGRHKGLKIPRLVTTVPVQFWPWAFKHLTYRRRFK